MSLYSKAMEIEDVVERADFVADIAHKKQRRKYTGEPYIVHPRRVEAKVSEHPKSTPTMRAASKLHDVREDTWVDEITLRSIFGDEITDLVVELTNPSKEMDVNSTTRRQRKAVDLEHLKQVSWEAKIIKLCDRIDNLRDLSRAKTDFRRKYAGESLALVEAIGDADENLKEELVELCHELYGNDQQTIDRPGFPVVG